MKLLKPILLFSVFLFLAPLTGHSQEFVYRPVNPAFGGNYLNYQWLLSSAQAQSPFKEEQAARDLFTRDPLADFESNLSRQILSQLSSRIMQEQFGEGPLGEGKYTFGNYEIEVTPGLEGLILTIFDSNTGSETTITIPHY